VNLLIDANIILEISLDQEKAEESRQFLNSFQEHEFFMTDFSIHSIGVILYFRDRKEGFQYFLHDVISKMDVGIAVLSLEDMNGVLEVSEKFGLDFDDSYQYMAAKKYGLTLVSFDSHFDKTDLKRKTPGQIIKRNNL